MNKIEMKKFVNKQNEGTRTLETFAAESPRNRKGETEMENVSSAALLLDNVCKI